MLVVVASFQAALALGAPWGVAAWGGAHAGVLPDDLRWSSAVAVPVYLVLVGFVASRRGGRARRPLLTGLSVLFMVGAVMNAASPSWVERLTWAPQAAVLAWSLWALRREEVARG